MAFPPAFNFESAMVDANSLENQDLSCLLSQLINVTQKRNVPMHGNYQQPAMTFDARCMRQNNQGLRNPNPAAYAAGPVSGVPMPSPAFLSSKMDGTLEEAVLPPGGGWAEDENEINADWHRLQMGRGDRVRRNSGTAIPKSVPPPPAQILPEDSNTTLMVRNIPARYSKAELAREFRCSEMCDFLYLPGTCGSKTNHSYAFINFKSSVLAKDFMQQWHKRRLARFGAQKALNICVATVQGFGPNLELVTKKRRGNHCEVDTCFCVPMIFDRTLPSYGECSGMLPPPPPPLPALNSAPALSPVGVPSYQEVGQYQVFSF